MTTYRQSRNVQDTGSTLTYQKLRPASTGNRSYYMRLAPVQHVFATGRCVAPSQTVFFDPSASAVKNMRLLGKSADKRIYDMQKRLEHMLTLELDWNGYGSEPPNGLAVELAKQIVLLSHQLNLVPSRVVASASGGAGVCFYSGNKYADIECFNTGEIVAIKSDGVSDPEVWDVSPAKISEAIKQIREYVTA